jgi:hypothetical protein
MPVGEKMKNPCEHRRQYEGKWMVCEFHNDLHSKIWEPCTSCKRRIDYAKANSGYVQTNIDFSGVYQENYRAMEEVVVE